MKIKRITKIVLGISIIIINNCAVDIKQIPEPRIEQEISISYSDKTVYIGKLDVYSSNSVNYTKAWRYVFQSFLKNNRIFKEVLDGSGKAELNQNSYILDIEIYPKYDDRYDYWWTWPAVYPMVGYWPVQKRISNYEVAIKYKFSQGKNLLFEGETKEEEEKTVLMYGFYRTSGIEKMIEEVNLRVLDKCAKEILSKAK